MLCYSRESVIAEKYEVMLKHGELNSRMKDFHDIWLLSRQFDFNGARLAKAVRLTLERRGTEVPAAVVAFSGAFAASKQVQWTAFRKRLGQTPAPESFEDVVLAVSAFLSPIISNLAADTSAPTKWTAFGPWV
jgi:hypothetical protein